MLENIVYTIEERLDLPLSAIIEKSVMQINTDTYSTVYEAPIMFSDENIFTKIKKQVDDDTFVLHTSRFTTHYPYLPTT